MAVDLSKVDWKKLERRIEADIQAARDSQLRRMAEQFSHGEVVRLHGNAFDGMTGRATAAMSKFAAIAVRAFANWVEQLGPFLEAMRIAEWTDFRDEWITSDARAIAAGIVESGDWSRLAILADAIQDAGCEDAALLGLMRLAGSIGLDMGGWWLVERVNSASLQG